MATVLVVGGTDPGTSGLLDACGAWRGHDVVRTATLGEGIDAVPRIRPDLVLVDFRSANGSPLDAMNDLRDEETVVIAVAPAGDASFAARLMRAGVEHVLTPPLDGAALDAAVSRALETSRLRQLVRRARERRGAMHAEALLGGSSAMRELAHQVELVAAADPTTVLLLGEPGTGKGRLAEAMHGISARRAGPFVDVDCAGLPPDALAEELFGRAPEERARPRRTGVVELAEKGTLFLDEIAVLDGRLQPQLLTLLESRTFRRPDSGAELAADVRVIAATGRDLVAEVSEGRFREELYYRLSVMPVHLPPLRARSREDLEMLIARCLEELRTPLLGAPAALSDGALHLLLRHPWPGNLRELRNVLERAMLLARGAERIDVEHLPPEVRRAGTPGPARHVPRSLAEVERAHIERTLRAHRSNRTRAARELGISRATLINKIKGYGLTRDT